MKTLEVTQPPTGFHPVSPIPCGTHLPLAPVHQPLHFWRWLRSRTPFNTQLSSHGTTFYKLFVFQILALTAACVCSRMCTEEGFTFHGAQLSTYFPYGISLFKVCVLSYVLPYLANETICSASICLMWATVMTHCSQNVLSLKHLASYPWITQGKQFASGIR